MKNGLQIANSIFLVVIIILLLNRGAKNEQQVANTVTVELDTAYVMSELRKLQFQAKKDSIVYVTRYDVKQFETVREPIVYYYSDTTTIIQNNDRPIAATLTKDTIETKDGAFYSTILSDGPIYNNELSYQLNTPTITRIVTKTLESKSRLLLSGTIGGNANQFGFSSGLMWQHSKGYGLQYQYDFINRTHEVGGFYPLYAFGKK